SSGIFLCGTQLDRQFRIPLRVDQNYCVLFADSSAPVVEYREPGFSEDPPFVFSGANNFYPRSTVFFRHTFRQDGAPPKDHGFGSLPRWAVELITFQGTAAAPPPDSPVHEHLPGDYVLKSPADTNAGCSLALLPTVESAVR